jgi:hypothetical protein
VCRGTDGRPIGLTVRRLFACKIPLQCFSDSRESSYSLIAFQNDADWAPFMCDIVSCKLLSISRVSASSYCRTGIIAFRLRYTVPCMRVCLRPYHRRRCRVARPRPYFPTVPDLAQSCRSEQRLAPRTFCREKFYAETESAFCFLQRVHPSKAGVDAQGHMPQRGSEPSIKTHARAFCGSSCGVAADSPCCSWPPTPTRPFRASGRVQTDAGVSAPSLSAAAPKRGRALGRWSRQFFFSSPQGSVLCDSLVSLFFCCYLWMRRSSHPPFVMNNLIQFCFRRRLGLLWTNLIPKTLSDLFFWLRPFISCVC